MSSPASCCTWMGAPLGAVPVIGWFSVAGAAVVPETPSDGLTVTAGGIGWGSSEVGWLWASAVADQALSSSPNASAARPAAKSDRSMAQLGIGDDFFDMLCRRRHIEHGQRGNTRHDDQDNDDDEDAKQALHGNLANVGLLFRGEDGTHTRPSLC